VPGRRLVRRLCGRLGETVGGSGRRVLDDGHVHLEHRTLLTLETGSDARYPNRTGLCHMLYLWFAIKSPGISW
jgi:hypothetical protein